MPKLHGDRPGVHTGGRVNEREALECLGRIHEITLDYHDIWGQRHAVPDASLTALLAALGVRSGTPQEVEDSIRAAEFERWRAVVPPAIVVREETAPWNLRLNLPAAEANSPLAWRLTEEDGKRHEGSFETTSRNVVESAELDSALLRQRALPGRRDDPGLHRMRRGARHAPEIPRIPSTKPT